MMDEHVFETGKNDITGEHAVLIPALSSVKSLMPYVEAVAVVIGSCHIHSVFEDRENIKIYLKDKRFVDILVSNGISILGRQINVDYALPRADKVLLSNVDPIIPDSILIKLLCYYGDPVSAIIHEKIATNSEYSHIECGRRKVYMKILSGKKVPTKINFTYQNMFFRIDVSIEPSSEDVCETVSMPTLSEEQLEDANDALEVESSVNMKPDVEEVMPKKQPSAKQLAYHLRGKSKGDSAANMARRLKKRARKGWYGTRHAMAKKKFNKKKKETLKLAVKKHVDHEQKKKPKSPEVVMKKPKTSDVVMKTEAASTNNSVIDENPSPSIAVESKDFFDQMDATDASQSITEYPLTINDLGEFMKKTRFQRDPCPIAWEFLSDKTPESIEALKVQLREFIQVTKDQSAKFRIRRVIASLKYTKDSSSE